LLSELSATDRTQLAGLLRRMLAPLETRETRETRRDSHG
jgi:hypothetical protein